MAAVVKGRDYDLVGTSYDPKTGQVTLSPLLTEAQRQAIRKSLVQGRRESAKLGRKWA
jgi:hypothetical protein